MEQRDTCWGLGSPDINGALTLHGGLAAARICRLAMMKGLFVPDTVLGSEEMLRLAKERSGGEENEGARSTGLELHWAGAVGA